MLPAKRVARKSSGKNVPQMVIATPVIFSGVSSSPKNHADTEIVDTSFAIPAIDMGTTPARCMIL